LRKATAALLAAPILVAASLDAAMRRSTRSRVSLALGMALIGATAAVAVGVPPATVATPTSPIVPLTQAAFKTAVATNRGLRESVTITFSTPMDHASVAAAVHVEPDEAVALSWNADDTVLSVSPRTHWAPGVFHTVTVEAGALARTGQPLARPARAIFLTRAATAVSIAATDGVGERIALGASFVVTFARPVDRASIPTAIRLDPPTAGTVEPVELPGGTTGASVRYRFVPTSPLRPNAPYRVIVSGARDADGLALATTELAVRTVVAPTVVRFRPRADSTGVARDAVVSVRFSERMERRSTGRAFSVKVAGKALAGKVAWTEGDTVLVFTPSKALPAGTTVAMDVSAIARAASGVPLAGVTHATFKTATGGGTRAAKAPSAQISGGAAVGGGSWAAVETYYLGLMNCTRTGGWVTSTGRCSSPGGRNVAPLKLDRGISSKVSRPYAKRLAIGADCSHFIGGNPGDRLRRAGYTSYRWAENLGCRSGDPRKAVLASHLFFQSEKSYNGGHYVNLMNAKYDRVGIGVWVSGGRVRLVIDFYHP
jgi:uncharacterized protein YkwD